MNGAVLWILAAMLTVATVKPGPECALQSTQITVLTEITQGSADSPGHTQSCPGLAASHSPIYAIAIIQTTSSA